VKETRYFKREVQVIQIKRGIITREIFTRKGIQAFEITIDENKEKCIVYPDLTGEVKPGDEVIVNTTAFTLNLGTGGYHYVIANLSRPEREFSPGGHIMKMRYTPMQLKVLSVEEEDSPYRQEMLLADSLKQTPVLVGTLHSMLAPISLYLHSQGYRVAYVMTDGAALPLAFSNTVDKLKTEGVICGTVTTGHAFGGDLESVNVYSGLLAAKQVFKADVIICLMGPGIVGTGTKWGFTGIEQGDILNAVDTLHGIPIAIPRISFADPRSRHKGISHHTLTVLTRVCRVKAVLPIPELEPDKLNYILGQLQKVQVLDHYYCSLEKASDFIKFLKESSLPFSTMGRGVDEEVDFFLTLGAAARTAQRLLSGEKLNPITWA
jgi:hypothetical protein